MLSMRQRKIVDYVVAQASFIAIHDLAAQLKVTNRTIQYDLEMIEASASDLDLKIERNKSKGVKMTKLNVTNAKLTQSAVRPTLHYDKSERILYITLKLFESSEPTSSQTFAAMVSVSRRTIVEDLKVVQTWLESNGLSLVYKKNKGFVIEGEERNFRKAYAARVNEYFQTHTHYMGNQLFSNDELKQIRLAVISTLSDNNYHLVQSAIDGLIYHILIAIHRTRSNDVFEIPTIEYDKLVQTEQFRIAMELTDKLETAFLVEFPPSESAFITLHLLGAKSVAENDVFEDADELEILTHQLVELMSGELGVNLLSDNKLLDGLVVHLRPAIHRMKFKLTHKNPLNDEITQQYANIIQALKHHVWLIEQAYNIEFEADELSYITIHFASAIERLSSSTKPAIKVVLLCGSGIGTSQLLKSKIKNIYPELEVIDAYSVYEIDDSQLRNERIDYVISTVEVTQLSVPIVRVSPFLTQEDRMQLNDIINASREKYVNDVKMLGPNLQDVLPKEHIITHQPKVTRNSAIQQAVDILVAKSIVDINYGQDIINQLDAFGPYMVISPHIALIHAQHKHVRQGVGFSIVHFAEGIKFDHEQYDPVNVIITLATEQPQIHLNALRQLSELIMDETTRTHLLQGDKPQIIEAIKQISIKEDIAKWP
ncbi:PTS sugar transporter subunit IIA [Staphylococcus arlettae]|nr:BglG family transcription antiterminator [Staphylococcus arlettae]PTH24531.1 PTS sugar transporter subunit IIA [Staphylococcus arlettae]PTH30836.1 PTS sugar transporter subunit IIA [Staphylococcus arlettae]PTH53797.1 PTS sugar transporter subunit IIA [Staphylococcus arlettae]PTH57830.1 PTS sugar transporter subunit IIA [Staphylococcus arlettae]PUZ33058.1 PRD domain-containing protein [Staphylococcus arlettae]